MLRTITVVLVLLWFIGLAISYSMGGFIHILLVIAAVVVLMNFLQGRRKIFQGTPIDDRYLALGMREVNIRGTSMVQRSTR